MTSVYIDFVNGATKTVFGLHQLQLFMKVMADIEWIRYEHIDTKCVERRIILSRKTSNLNPPAVDSKTFLVINFFILKKQIAIQHRAVCECFWNIYYRKVIIFYKRIEAHCHFYNGKIRINDKTRLGEILS